MASTQNLSVRTSCLSTNPALCDWCKLFQKQITTAFQQWPEFWQKIQPNFDPMFLTSSGDWSMMHLCQCEAFCAIHLFPLDYRTKARCRYCNNVNNMGIAPGLKCISVAADGEMATMDGRYGWRNLKPVYFGGNPK